MNIATEGDAVILCDNHKYEAQESEQYRLEIKAAKLVSQELEFSMKDVGISTFVKENYYYEYNFFVEQYNNDVNRIRNKYMKKLNWLMFTTMPCSSCYFIWIFCSLIVMFSVPTFIYNLIRFITLINIINTLKENKKNVPNPLENMIYCKGLVSVNEYYLITTRIYTTELKKLGISIDCFNYVISSVDNSSHAINLHLMFYRDQFAKFFTNPPKAVCFDMCITTTLLLISLISTILSIVILNSAYS